MRYIGGGANTCLIISRLYNFISLAILTNLQVKQAVIARESNESPKQIAIISSLRDFASAKSWQSTKKSSKHNKGSLCKS